MNRLAERGKANEVNEDNGFVQAGGQGLVGQGQGCKELDELVIEARLSTLWGEWAREAGLWKRALALAGEEASATQRAEILEGIERAERGPQR